MARTAAAYYVRVDTYWQNSPDRFAGPFETREAAQAEIERVVNEPESNAWLATSQSGGNIRYAVRIFPDILTATEAKRQGMRPLGALRGTNMIGERIPANMDELYAIEGELAEIEG